MDIVPINDLKMISHSYNSKMWMSQAGIVFVPRRGSAGSWELSLEKKG